MSKKAGTLDGDSVKKLIEEYRGGGNYASERLAQTLGGFTEISEDAGRRLFESGAISGLARSWLRLDKLAYLTPQVAKAIAQAGALSLKAVKKLDQETARELAKHGCQLILSGVEEASDEAIQNLAETKADLFLDSLGSISNRALERLVRFPGKKLVLGLRELDENQAKIFELYQGDYLVLRSLSELSDAVAESLGRLSLGGVNGRLSLPNVKRFSEEAARHFASQERGLTISGQLTLSEKAFRALTEGSTKFGSSWLLLSGWIEIPDYAYEIVYTDSIANTNWVKSGSGRSILDESGYTVLGRFITEDGATWLTPINPLYLDLQSLPDAVAAVLARHIGFLSITTDTRPSLAALESLAARKYDKRFKGSGLQLGLKKLNAEEASRLAESACPLYLPQLRGLPDEAAVELAKHKGNLCFSDCIWPSSKMAKGRWSTEMVAKQWIKDGAMLSKVAIKALSKKEGSIDGEPSSKWATKWLKACS